MKYIIVLGDGMADLPLSELGGKTPLAYASTKEMDDLANISEIGMTKTIPSGMNPGSDTANLAVLGYDPKKYYTGRSPLEALSIGVPMEDDDIAVRCNLVTLSDDVLPYEGKTILDHSASEISTEEAEILLKAVQKELESEDYLFYTGTSYRHLLIIKRGEVTDMTPPHDILGRKISDYLPPQAELADMMRKSHEILKNHPLNQKRREQGLNPANSFWFWGAGTKPALDSFSEIYEKKGAMISAVDLLKGIAVGTGMQVITVPGADGTLHTNYKGKALAGVEALLRGGCDFVYIHIEAPDEMGHQGNVMHKIEAIEAIDREVLKTIRKQMDVSGEPYRILLMPDHPTPVVTRTHSTDPVPYLLFDSSSHIKSNMTCFNEDTAEQSGNYVEDGFTMIHKLFQI